MSGQGRTTVLSSDGAPMAPEPSNGAVPGEQLPASENPPAEPTSLAQPGPTVPDLFTDIDPDSDTSPPPPPPLPATDIDQAGVGPADPSDLAAACPDPEPNLQPVDRSAREPARRGRKPKPRPPRPEPAENPDESKARPQWSKNEAIAAYRAAWDTSTSIGRKGRKILTDLSAEKYPQAVQWVADAGLWVKRFGDVDCVSPARSVELRAKRVWSQ